MDFHILYGWDETAALNVLHTLGVMNTVNISESEAESTTNGSEPKNHDEFAVSDSGIQYINGQLDVINKRYGCKLEWRCFTGDHFILVWEYLLNKQIGDPMENPTRKYYIEKEFPKEQFERFLYNIGFTNSEKIIEPYMICYIDASEYYDYHIYDHDNLPILDDDNQDLIDEVNYSEKIYGHSHEDTDDEQDNEDSYG